MERLDVNAPDVRQVFTDVDRVIKVKINISTIVGSGLSKRYARLVYGIIGCILFQNQHNIVAPGASVRTGSKDSKDLKLWGGAYTT